MYRSWLSLVAESAACRLSIFVENAASHALRHPQLGNRLIEQGQSWRAILPNEANW